MRNATCSVEGCPKAADASRGWCRMHYGRWRRTGDTGEASARYAKPDAEPFERLRHTGWTVTGTGCWEWDGSRRPTGYGVVSMGQQRLEYVHRVSWRVYRGAIPAGMFVCHRCDNPPCLNPEHLFLGTLQDNNADMLAKRRNVTPPPKLSEADVRDIRAARMSGVPGAELAVRYGVRRSYIYDLAAGRQRG